MNLVDRKKKRRFSKPLKLLIIAVGLVCGLAFYKINAYQSRVEREQEEQRQRDDAERLATFNEYVESGRLIGMTDRELVALLGSKEPYDRRDGIDYRSWHILTYHKPEMRNSMIDFGWRKVLSVESRDGKVVRCRIEDYHNG